MRLPRPGGDQARVVHRVDDLRALARLVVDLLVGARREEARKRVDDGQEPVPGHARGHRDHVLLGDPVLDEPAGLRELEPAHAAVGGQVGVEHHEPRLPRRELEQRLPVGRGDVLLGDAGTGRRGACTALRLALEAALALGVERRNDLERERREADAVDPLAQPALELAGRGGEVLVTGRARVPAVRAAALGERPRVLHERDALALDRLRDEDAGRLLRVLPQLSEGMPERGVVVAVARHDAAAERAQLRLEALEREDLLGRPVGLELVAVDDHEQATDALVRGRLERLPVLAFLELAVAGHDDDAPSATEVSLRPRDPTRLRDPHPERAGVRLDPRHAHVWVTVEAAEPAEPQQPLGRDHAERVERCVEARDVMALGREEDVAVGGVEADLGDVEVLPEEVGDEVEGAEGRAEMPGAGPLDRDERVRAGTCPRGARAGCRRRARRPRSARTPAAGSAPRSALARGDLSSRPARRAARRGRSPDGARGDQRGRARAPRTPAARSRRP